MARLRGAGGFAFLGTVGVVGLAGLVFAAGVLVGRAGRVPGVVPLRVAGPDDDGARAPERPGGAGVTDTRRAKASFYESLDSAPAVRPEPTTTAARPKLGPVPAAPSPAPTRAAESKVERPTPPAVRPASPGLPPPRSESARPREPREVAEPRAREAAEPRNRPRAQYTVQVGAFDARALAEGLRGRLGASGHEAYLDEGAGRPRYRVRVGAYGTREDARRAAVELRAARGVATFVTTR